MRTLTLKVMNKTLNNTLHGTNFQVCNCRKRLVYLRTNLGKLVERSTRLYLPLFQLVSIPTSVATFGIHSDAPYEHAQCQGWIIGVKYRQTIHPYGAISFVHFMQLCTKYIYTYRTSFNLNTPDSVSVASLAGQYSLQLIECHF